MKAISNQFLDTYPPTCIVRIHSMKHIIYTFKDKVYQANKYWSIQHCEAVLNRLGASYWEIG